MSHQCIIQIDNSKNIYPLTLQSISDPDKTKNSADGTFSNIIPSSTTIEVGAIVPSGETLSFQLTKDLIETAGAILVWASGSADDETQVSITMEFKNDTLGNLVSLDVNAEQDATSALLAYGVSYFEASEENNDEMARDFLNSKGLSHSPVYANFNIVYNSFVQSPPATPPLKGITNVVMLMLENRAFDHLLGELYTSNPNTVFPNGSAPPSQNSTVDNPINFDGLANNPDFSNTSSNGGGTVTISPVSGSLDIPEEDPGEQWLDANQQLFNSTSTPAAGATPNMAGFLNNYEAQKKVTAGMASQIMQYYTSSDLPVLSSLAKNYAVSDAWFCSVPSQTSPNRAFSLAGTSTGYVDNYDVKGISPEHSVVFKSNTLFNVLSNCGIDDWKIYYQEEILGNSLTEFLFEQLHQYKGTDQISTFDTFLDDITNDQLPAFTYLEPSWVSHPKKGVFANDYHPPYNVCPGEQNLANVYNALTQYKNWETTLFIVTFDEHGGTFDHVPPPATIAPDKMTDWSGFNFDRLGLRVPTLLISPMIEKGMVFRSPDTNTPLDHTSFIKTILGWQGIDVSGGVMGARAAQAPDFSGALSNSVVNDDITLDPPTCPLPNEDLKLNDLQQFLLPMLAQTLCPDIESDLFRQILADLKSKETCGELVDYVTNTRNKK